MYSNLVAAVTLASITQAHASAPDPITTIKCEAEQPTPALTTLTFTVVAVVDPSISHWDQFLNQACPTPFPTPERCAGAGKDQNNPDAPPGADNPGHESTPHDGVHDIGWYEVWWFDYHGGEPPSHWYFDHHSSHPYSTDSYVPWPKPTGGDLPPGPLPVPTREPRPRPDRSTVPQPRPDPTSKGRPRPPSGSSTDQPIPTSETPTVAPKPFSSTTDQPNPVQSSMAHPEPTSDSSSTPPMPIVSSTSQSGPEPSSDPSSPTAAPFASSTSQSDSGPSSIDPAQSSSVPPEPQPPSSLAPTSLLTSVVSSTTTSASPSQTCADISNGSFQNNDIGAWYISDEVTADSGIVQEGPDGVEYSFALIPSQQQFAQVYINQYIRCGDPPPIVEIEVRFSYQFTGNSQGCSIAASVNRSPDNLLTIQDDGQSPGVWQQYEGPVITVQLTYDPLFTIKMLCQEDTANTEAILITEISVYN
ncbi:hypothetical protein BN1723_000248 [Verticillium longisporum]|uniref:Uncharacterized protein n=1 Tax=Verticillium longisporum TaxID=100787 RepID=A0A0G4KF15_VERLO|nr:hypothetical protein HYQ46_000908 [Verticillium longisporum]CRJ87202.1 hypothetical protein BN1723_000248 [Verticillium longisporum]CRK34981.1 hypothetical protein BN1708_006606 [Verticillium longisporum]